jgi:RNA polymerase-binding protein DksA
MALTSDQLDHYRRILTARRQELASETVRAESEVADQDDQATLDPGDLAVADVAKDDLLQQAGRDSTQLEQVEAALARIDHGTYGICDVCGKEIPKSRLDAVPWATLCVQDQEIFDRKHSKDSGTLPGGEPSRVTL